ncbi:MAG TPA: MFS transporter [bacterium]|nr:MFS transporter [bacterium]
MFALTGASHGLLQFAGAVAVAGLILGNTGVMFSALTDLVPRRRLGFAMAVVSMMGPLGFAIGPAAGGVVADRFGIRTLFFIDAGLALTTARWIADAFREAPRTPSSLSAWTMVLQALRALAVLPPIRLLFVLSFVGWVSNWLVGAYIPVAVGGCAREDVPPPRWAR